MSDTMRMAKVILIVAMVFTVTAVADVQFAKRHLRPLIRFAQEHNANLLVYDQYDQTRCLAVLTPGRIFDIPTELKSFTKPKSSKATPSLSPDITQVAFVQGAAKNEGQGQQEIWIVSVRSGAATKIAQFTYVLSVAWSPAGNALAVNTGGELRMLELASHQSRLIATDISSNVASWSPDGHQITYESATGTGDKRNFHVNVVDVETGKADKIAEGRYPSWSPRGDRIAYLDERKQVYLSVAPSGGQSSSLIGGGKKLHGDHILSEPVVWSPDARYVVVTGYYDGGTSMTLVDLTTSKQTVLHQGGDWLLASWR